jgi:hypothetical protein
MTTAGRRKRIAVAGAGAVACAACCAAPVGGALTAIAASSIFGGLVFGLAGMLVAAAMTTVVVRQRRARRDRRCGSGRPSPAPRLWYNPVDVVRSVALAGRGCLRGGRGVLRRRQERVDVDDSSAADDSAAGVGAVT